MKHRSGRNHPAERSRWWAVYAFCADAGGEDDAGGEEGADDEEGAEGADGADGADAAGAGGAGVDAAAEAFELDAGLLAASAARESLR